MSESPIVSSATTPETELVSEKILMRLAYLGGPFKSEEDVEIINWLANRELHRRAAPPSLPRPETETPFDLDQRFRLKESIVRLRRSLGEGEDGSDAFWPSDVEAVLEEIDRLMIVNGQIARMLCDAQDRISPPRGEAEPIQSSPPERKYPANFSELDRGIDAVVLPLGSVEAIERLSHDLIAFGYGAGDAVARSTEQLDWWEKAEASRVALMENVRALAKQERPNAD